MRRRSSKGGEPIKARRRKTVTLKRRNAPKAVRSSSDATHQTEMARVIRERDEALEQQTAISDILRVISNSPSNVQPVLDSVAEHAARMCEAQIVDIILTENDRLRTAATFGQLGRPPDVPLDRSSVSGRSICDRQSIHVTDMQNAGDEFALGRELAIKFGHRSALAIPLIREGRALGTILVRRTEVRPFEQKHIALLTTFADQAAIAIENVRLFKAEQQRTRELTESLEQQTATSEVLQVISSSPGELEPVFSTILGNATRICGAKFGTLYLREADGFRTVAMHNAPPAFVEVRQRNPVVRPKPGTVLASVVTTRRAVQIADVQTEADVSETSGTATTGAQLARLAGARTVVAVPMVKEDQLIGAILIFRQEVQPFSDNQIELLTNFAAQAVIAIENTRLLKELRQRTDDLTESLEQQTATSEVLQVISSSPGDLEPVFGSMLENAARICDAKFGNLFRWDGAALHLVATYNTPPAFSQLRSRSPFRPNPENPIGRLLATKAAVHVANLAAEKLYIEKSDPNVVAAVELGGIRTFVAVPMLKKSELIGAIIVYRQEVRPFTDKQIALVASFAAQAVIAIENARLLSELRKSLEQQTATSDVLQVISSSPGDVQPVFETMLANATRICEAKFGNIYRWDGDALHLIATLNTPPAFAEARRRTPYRPSPKTPAGRMVATKTVIHVADLAAEQAYIERSDPSLVASAELGGVRTALLVPMLKENELTGALTVYRQEVRPFTDKQIALLTNFASQAVIAIENARLLNELRNRCSSRLPPPTCCALFQARPAICSRCLQPCWRTP